MNKEITELINGIVNATKILKPGGKILIVSFHSIEDKIVKYFSAIIVKTDQELQGIFQILITKILLSAKNMTEK